MGMVRGGSGRIRQLFLIPGMERLMSDEARYLLIRWVDMRGEDCKIRAAYREDLRDLIHDPKHPVGAWTSPVPFDLQTAPARVRAPLEREGFFVEALPAPLYEAPKGPTPSSAIN